MQLVVMAPQPAAAALGESYDRFVRSCRVNGLAVQFVDGALGSEQLVAATRALDPDNTLVRATPTWPPLQLGIFLDLNRHLWLHPSHACTPPRPRATSHGGAWTGARVRARGVASPAP